MKYCAENQLELFEFHDARLELIRFGGGELVVSAKHLNIHKHTDQNPSDCDMEIACATITFHGVNADQTAITIDFILSILRIQAHPFKIVVHDATDLLLTITNNMLCQFFSRLTILKSTTIPT